MQAAVLAALGKRSAPRCLYIPAPIRILEREKKTVSGKEKIDKDNRRAINITYLPHMPQRGRVCVSRQIKGAAMKELPAHFALQRPFAISLFLGRRLGSTGGGAELEAALTALASTDLQSLITLQLDPLKVSNSRVLQLYKS